MAAERLERSRSRAHIDDLDVVVQEQLRDAAAELADQQARYAAYDAKIRPATVKLPDLTTPAARAAARKVGIYDVEAWVARNS